MMCFFQKLSPKYGNWLLPIIYSWNFTARKCSKKGPPISKGCFSKVKPSPPKRPSLHFFPNEIMGPKRSVWVTTELINPLEPSDPFNRNPVAESFLHHGFPKGTCGENHGNSWELYVLKSEFTPRATCWQLSSLVPPQESTFTHGEVGSSRICGCFKGGAPSTLSTTQVFLFFPYTKVC